MGVIDKLNASIEKDKEKKKEQPKFKDDLKKLKEDTKKDFKKTKENIKEDNRKINEKHELKMQQYKEEREAKLEQIELNKQLNQSNQPKTEQGKFAKKGNFIVRGMALWLLIPFLMVLVIILLFLGAGLLEWIGII